MVRSHRTRDRPPREGLTAYISGRSSVRRRITMFSDPVLTDAICTSPCNALIRRKHMKLTPGKLAGLKRVSKERGVIAAAAMDQRCFLQKSLAKEKGMDVSDSMME